MNILVIGCDQVGAALIRDLERIGHDISVVERTLSSSSVWMPLMTIPFTALPLWATLPTRTPCAGAAWRTATPWRQ